MMQKILKNRYLLLVLRLAIGCLFIYSGYVKIIQPMEFAIAIRGFQIFPDAITPIFALIIPWIELISGLALVAGFWQKSSAFLIIFLLGVFTLAVILAMARGLEIDCGCGVVLAGIDKVGWGKIAENIILIFLLLWISLSDNKFFSLDAFLDSGNDTN